MYRYESHTAAPVPLVQGQGPAAASPAVGSASHPQSPRTSSAGLIALELALEMAAPAAACAAGASAAGYVNSPIGNSAINKAVTFTVGNSGADTANMATGGLVMSPTLAMIGEAGPEMVLPLNGMSMMPKKKRSRTARAADKKRSKALKMANARYRLKNGQ